MKQVTMGKTAVLVAALVVASAVFGQVSGRVYREWEVVFSPGPELLDLAIWVLGTILLVATVAGLFVALVRPFRVIILGLALSGVAMVLMMGMGILSPALGLVYVILGIGYARSVVGELNERLHFSVRPLREEQGTLILALVLLISASFALGYREDAMSGDFIVPPAYKKAVMEMIVPHLLFGIESQIGPGAGERATRQEEVKREMEGFWAEIEKMLQPYAEFVPVVLGLLALGAVKFVLGFLLWLPPLVLSVIFPLLKAAGVTQVVTETREMERLTLG
ncbi:MAG: hypothetical protein ABIH46_00035 [Chloroflexota bacterium]